MAFLSDEKSDKQIEELHKKEEEELVQTLSAKYDIPYIDLSTVSIETDALKAIPEAEARKLAMAGFKLVGKNLYLAMAAPNKEGVGAMLEELKRKYAPFPYLASHASLERAWSRYKDVSYASETKSGVLDISAEALEEMAKTLKNVEDIKKTVESTLKEAK